MQSPRQHTHQLQLLQFQQQQCQQQQCQSSFVLPCVTVALPTLLVSSHCVWAQVSCNCSIGRVLANPPLWFTAGTTVVVVPTGAQVCAE
jgi:hypothetical protein